MSEAGSLVEGPAPRVQLGKILLLLFVTETFNNIFSMAIHKSWLDCYIALLSDREQKKLSRTHRQNDKKNVEKNVKC